MKLAALILIALFSLDVYSCDFLGNKNLDERLSLSKNIYIGSVVAIKSDDYEKDISNVEPFNDVDNDFFRHGSSRKIQVVVRKTLKGKPLKSIYVNIDNIDDACSVLSKGQLFDTIVIYENDSGKLSRPIKESEYKKLVNKF